MGGEFAQGSEWSADNGLDWWVLDFDGHQGVQRLSRDLNAAYRWYPAMWEQDSSPAGFSWIDANDAQGNVLSFIRFASGPSARPVVCIANFSAVPHLEYRVGLPQAGPWREVLNTDAAIYGGSGEGNLGGIEAAAEPWHGQPASATLVLPPMGVLWLSPAEPDGDASGE
jgi:1,4-alpha-glucan branching enzyme